MTILQLNFQGLLGNVSTVNRSILVQKTLSVVEKLYLSSRTILIEPHGIIPNSSEFDIQNTRKLINKKTEPLKLLQDVNPL